MNRHLVVLALWLVGLSTGPVFAQPRTPPPNPPPRANPAMNPGIAPARPAVTRGTQQAGQSRPVAPVAVPAPPQARMPASGAAAGGESRYAQPNTSAARQTEVSSPGPEQATPKDPIDAAIQDMDNDHNGRISIKEARGLYLELFQEIDANQDGYLDRNEIVRAMERFPGLRGYRPGFKPTIVASPVSQTVTSDK